MTKLTDISAKITAELVAAIEALPDDAASPTLPWHQTGAANHLAPRNASTGNYYQGANIVFLFFAATENGFARSQWATYKQWQALDCQVAKGQTSTTLFRWVIKDTDPDDPDAKTRAFPVAFRVFNVEQLTDPDAAPTPTGFTPIGHDPIPQAETFFEHLGVDVVEGSDRAFYRIATDQIHVPHHHQFDDPEMSWAVRLHEAAHWTGATHRLDREIGHERKSPEYAKEELVAELAASIACARLGIGNHLRDDHASYLQSWLTALKADPRYLTSAAEAASKAVAYMESAQPAHPETNTLAGAN